MAIPLPPIVKTWQQQIMWFVCWDSSSPRLPKIGNLEERRDRIFFRSDFFFFRSTLQYFLHSFHVSNRLWFSHARLATVERSTANPFHRGSSTRGPHRPGSEDTDPPATRTTVNGPKPARMSSWSSASSSGSSSGSGSPSGTSCSSATSSGSGSSSSSSSSSVSAGALAQERMLYLFYFFLFVCYV